MFPINDTEYQSLFSNLPLSHDSRIAVGVSGGKDSLCLAILEHRRNPDMLALICDHGLRQESAQEAQEVKEILNSWNIRSKILNLGMLSGSAIQERARLARYEAMVQAMLEDGFEPGKGVLLVGHHRMDQAETIAYRAMRGSGVKGITGMQSVRSMDCFCLARPFLDVDSKRFAATLTALNQRWIEDPSNQNPRFTRVRIRQKLSTRPEVVDEILHQRQEAIKIMQSYKGDWEERIKQSVLNHSHGAFCIDLGCLGQDQTSALALCSLISKIVPIDMPAPDLESAKNLLRNKKGTLGGAILFSGRAGLFWLARESNRMQKDIPARSWNVWDGRYRIANFTSGGLTLGCLGENASQMRNMPHAQHFPYRILQTLPAWRKQDKELVSVPSLEWGEKFPPLIDIHAQNFLTTNSVYSNQSTGALKSGIQL